MNRHITSLPIPNHIKTKLGKNGVDSVYELKNLKPSDLIKGLVRNFSSCIKYIIIKISEFLKMKLLNSMKL